MELQKLFASRGTNKNHRNTQVKTVLCAKPDEEHKIILNHPKTVCEEFSLSRETILVKWGRGLGCPDRYKRERKYGKGELI